MLCRQVSCRHLKFIAYEVREMNLKSTGKTKEEIKEMYNKYFYETFQRFDFIAERGEDDYVIDETGKRYLDFMAGNCS